MATGFTTVSATQLQDATGTVITNATIYFAPVANNGSPISFRAGGNEGQVISAPVSAIVTSGAFSIQLADTTLTLPVNIGYAVTVLDNLTGKCLLGVGYGCVQPSGTTWSFDRYQPNLGAQVTMQYGPEGPQGIQGVQGVQGPIGQSASVGTLTGNYVDAAVSGTQNGSNTIFTVAQGGYWRVLLNGVRQFSPKDYTQSGTNGTTLTTVSFVLGPTDNLTVESFVPGVTIPIGPTPASSSDTSTPGIPTQTGSVWSDDSYLYRRNSSGTINRIAWGSF